MAAALLPWFVIGAVSLAALGLSKKAKAGPDELDPLDPVDPVTPAPGGGRKYTRAEVDEAVRMALESGDPAIMLALVPTLEQDGYQAEADLLRKAATKAAADDMGSPVSPGPGYSVPPGYAPPVNSVPVNPPIKVPVPPPDTVPIAPPIALPPLPPSAPPIDLSKLPLPSLPGFSTQPVGGAVPIDAVPIKPPIKVPVPPPDAVPIPAPTPAAPKPDLSTRAGVAAATYAMLKNSEPSKTVQDPKLLKVYQTQEGLTADGVYGPGTGKSLIKYGFVPPRPFQSMSAKAAKDWRGNMNYMAGKDPQRAEEWREAAMV